MAIIRENPILRLALHCVMGPGSYNSFIFRKSIALFILCTGILGRKPVPCYTAWSLELLSFKSKVLNNCLSSHTSHMTDLEFIVFNLNSGCPYFPHGQLVVLVLQIYIHRILVYSWNDIRKALYPYISFSCVLYYFLLLYNVI